MRIRTQFVFLITGIIVIPFLVLGLIRFRDYLSNDETTIVPSYDEVQTFSVGGVDRATWERLSAFLARKPKHIDNIVLDRNFVVLYSTVPGYPTKTRLSASTLVSLIWNSGGRFIYQIDSPSMSDNSGLMLVSRIVRKTSRLPEPFVRLIHALLITLAALFAFACAMTILIARSITKSVTLLEESTRRIAAGELDLAIEAKGSNEITSLTASLNRMRLALKEDEAGRTRFIMGVSHDLKTPLALIKGYAEAISDGVADNPDAVKKSLEIVGTKVNQLEGMIDDLIGFVKLDTGEWRQHLENRAIAPILRSYARRLNEDATLFKRKFSYSIDIPDSVTAQLDDRLLVRALENIVNNALRYTNEGGAVSLDARVVSSPERSDVVIAIADNGIGIAESEIPHIFDLFWRGTASRREVGMGLGLSVVKSVADSHGWKVGVASIPGAGTTFTLTIPLA